MAGPESNNVETALSSRIEFSAEDFLPLFPDEGYDLAYSYALTPEACKSKLNCQRTAGHCCFLSHPDDGPLKAYVVTYHESTELLKCAYQGKSSVLVGPEGDRDFLVQSGAFQRGFLYHLNDGGYIEKQPEANKLLWTLPIRQKENCLMGIHNEPVSVAGPEGDDTLKVACAQSCGRYNHSGYSLVSWRADTTATPTELSNIGLFYENCQESILLKADPVPTYGYRWEESKKEAWCSTSPPLPREWSEWSGQQSTGVLCLTWPGPTTQTLNHS